MINQMDGASTKSRIIETALRLFHEQGYTATGIATILREAKVNSGSLYHFFPSKEALRAQLVGAISGPLTQLVSLLQAPQRELAYILAERGKDATE